MDEKIFYIFKKIVVEMVECEVYEELSKDEEMDIYLDILFEMFFKKFVLMLFN